jgi:hypothetical protein
MNEINSDVVTMAWIAIALVAIGLLIAGATKNVVIYYNGKDMLNSFLSVFLFFAVFVMANMKPFESDEFNWVFQWLFTPIIALICIYSLIMNFIKAVKHNRSILLGLVIGLFKIIFISLIGAVIIDRILIITNKGNSNKTKVSSAVFLFVFIFLAHAMINGHKVYEKRNWPIV